jgi:ABC-type multidrug transport system ATPase subunit
LAELLRAEALCKTYGNTAALDGVSLAAQEGECVGVFGFSGAGKTTLLKLLAGEETPASGTVSRSGGQIGFARRKPFLSGRLTPSEALWLYAALYRIPRGKRRSVISNVLSLTGLEAQRDTQVRSLPSGEQKLLEIARALLSPGDMLILDEPMADLDSYMRHRLWEHLLKLRAHAGKAIVIATSRPEDAELCDRIALLHRGRVLASGTPAELRGVIAQEVLIVRPIGAKPVTSTKPLWNGVVESEHDDFLSIDVNPESPPTEILRQVPYDASAIRITRKGLDSILGELASKAEER